MSILSIHYHTHILFLGLVLWLTCLYYFKRLGKVPILISLTLFLFFTSYVPSLDAVETSSFLNKPTETHTFTGQIIGPVDQTEEKIEFKFQIEDTEDIFLVLYFPEPEETVTSEAVHQLKTGDSCRITGEVSLPEESRNPGQFDYREYLKTKGISHQMIIQSLADVKCEGQTFINHIYELREYIQTNITETYSEETAAWMIALVLGDDSFIDEETIELFRNWGLSHLLAISGLHVGLIVGLVYFILIKLGIMTKEKAQWVMLCFLPIYALIAGGEPSVWRASIMVSIVILLSKWKWHLTATDVISIVFLTLIFVDKFIVYHVGFQLSFIVTFALILSRKWLTNTKSSFFQLLRISFVSQLVIIPLQFIYFFTVQPLSILLNVIVVPYFSLFVIPSMFLLAMLSFLPIIPSVFDYLFVHSLSPVLTLINRLEDVMNYPWIMGDIPTIFIVLYYIVFILLMYYATKNVLKTAFKYGVILTLLITMVIIRPYFSPYGSVTMIDMGQGDTFIIELPYREGVVFMDAGATFSFTDMAPSDKVFTQIIKPYLQYQGISAIDKIFISHEDMDHMGSVNYLIDEFDVKEVVTSPFYNLSEESVRDWTRQGTGIKIMKQNEQITLANVTFKVLSPIKDSGSENENSLVIYTKIGGKSWLFTGDIGVEIEKEIIKNYPTLTVDVLKAGHHGSKTSTDKEFVNHIKPDYALISAGQNNRYGHPSPEVLETLDDAGVLIFRTDTQGAVVYRFKQEEGTFFKFLP